MEPSKESDPQWLLYATVKNYITAEGRQLSKPFWTLPSKKYHQNYYEVIEHPVSLRQIHTKIKQHKFSSLVDAVDSFNLMFDNAKKYNCPNSWLFKDAKKLQKIMQAKAAELTDPSVKDSITFQPDLSENTNNAAPNVEANVQELLQQLFNLTYNHQDEDGRRFSYSLVKFYETNSSTDSTKKVLNLDMIKRNLDKGNYKRLDHFQQDMFEVFEHVRRHTRTDSRAFEDSVALQSFFIERRDESSRRVLLSPALQYTEDDLRASVETLRKQKLPIEQQEVEIKKEREEWSFFANEHMHIVPREEQVDAVCAPSTLVTKSEDKPDLDDVVVKPGSSQNTNLVCEVPNPDKDATYYEQYTIPSGTYKLGDCCYVQTKHNTSFIGRIDRMWTDKMGTAYFRGPRFVSPRKVKLSFKFFPQEVLMSSIKDTNPLLNVTGHCAVLDFKDYCIMRPTEIPEQDIYVCESRYLEIERRIQKLTTALHKIPVTSNVVTDEFYFFPKPITPEKTEVIEQPSLLEKMIFCPTISTDKGRQFGDGYVLYTKLNRRSVVAKNPKMSFGDISHLIRMEWRQLPTKRKVYYEGRARKAKEPGPVVRYRCSWDTCDHKCDDRNALMDHLATHLATESVLQCKWDNCQALNKYFLIFTSVSRLICHVKEVHLQWNPVKRPASTFSPQLKKKLYHSRKNSATRPLQTDTTTPPLNYNEDPPPADTGYILPTNSEKPPLTNAEDPPLVDIEDPQVADIEVLLPTDTENPPLTDTGNPPLVEVENPQVADIEDLLPTDTENPLLTDTGNPPLVDVEDPQVADIEDLLPTDTENPPLTDTGNPPLVDVEDPQVADIEDLLPTDTDKPVLTDTDRPVLTGDDPLLNSDSRQVRRREGGYVFEGRRLVNMAYFLRSLQTLNDHGGGRGCNFSDMRAYGETENHSWNVGIVFKCKLCPTTKIIWMEDPSVREEPPAPIIFKPQKPTSGTSSKLQRLLTLRNQSTQTVSTDVGTPRECSAMQMSDLPNCPDVLLNGRNITLLYSPLQLQAQPATDHSKSHCQWQAPNIDQSRVPIIGQSQHPLIGQSKDPTTIGQSQHHIIGQSQHHIIGQSQYPTIEQSHYSIIGQSQHPIIGQSKDPTIEQSQYPFIGQSQHPIIGQSQGPSIRQKQGPSIDQSQGPSMCQSQGPSTGQSQDLATVQLQDPLIGLTQNNEFQGSVDDRPQTHSIALGDFPRAIKRELPDDQMAIIISSSSEAIQIENTTYSDAFPEMDGSEAHPQTSLPWPSSETALEPPVVLPVDFNLVKMEIDIENM